MEFYLKHDIIGTTRLKHMIIPPIKNNEGNYFYLFVWGFSSRKFS